MSQPTTVMIQFNAIGDPDHDLPDVPTDFKNTAAIQEIVARLCDAGDRFEPLTGWGGWCAPQADPIYGGCFNYFFVDEFMRALEQLDWVEPDLLRVFIQTEDDDACGVWIMHEGQMVPAVHAV